MNEVARVQNPARGGSKKMTGVERAAALLLALGQSRGASVLQQFEEDEIRTLTIAMTQLGSLTDDQSEEILLNFFSDITKTGSVMGNAEAAESFLREFLPPEKVAAIMEEVRGPAGRNMWEKLSNVQEQVLANYFKNEYPQTVAVVLSKIKPDHASRVLSQLPEEFSLDVVQRMLQLGSVQKDIVNKIEQTLRLEFMSNLSRTRRRDAHEQMAEIFNSFDRQTEARFMSSLEERNAEDADKIKSLMFTFDDLSRLDNPAIQGLLRGVDKAKLALALKGAKASLKSLFMDNMSARAFKMLSDDMEALGPVRLKDVDEAQTYIVNMAKDMAARGEIIIAKNNDEDEMVF